MGRCEWGLESAPNYHNSCAHGLVQLNAFCLPFLVATIDLARTKRGAAPQEVAKYIGASFLGTPQNGGFL